jgi:hypothetical protein
MNVFSNELHISDLLLRKLNEAFPDKLPPIETNIENLRFRQGQRSVVEYLTQIYKEVHNIDEYGSSTKS